jgi:hypothetical protein
MIPFGKRRARRATAWLVLVAAAASPLGPGSAPAAPPQAADIDRLIRQLGSPRFAEREAATKAPDALGEPALHALEKAITSAGDPEVRRRAQSVRSAIRGRLWAEVRRFEGRGRARW